VAYLTRNDLFSYLDGNGTYIWDDILVIRDELNGNDSSWEFRRRPAVERIDDLYHDLNRVDIRVVPDYSRSPGTEAAVPEGGGPAREVLISLEVYTDSSYTPNLAEVLVRVDEGQWEVSPALVRLRPPSGSPTVVEARIRNRFGVLGPVSRLVVPPQLR